MRPGTGLAGRSGYSAAPTGACIRSGRLSHMARKRKPKAKEPLQRHPTGASVALGEAARVWRRDMTIELEKLIGEADATSARAVDAAMRVRDLLARRPKV